MVTVSSSISPLSNKSTFILPASIFIRLTNVFARAVSTRGGGGNTGFFIISGGAIASVSFVTGITGLFAGGLTGDLLKAFFGAVAVGFLAIGFFTAGFFTADGATVFFASGLVGAEAFLAGGGGGTHSRKVISSIAKSLPQPPGL